MQQQLQWQNQKMLRLDQSSTTQLVEAKQTGASSDLNPAFSENIGSDKARHHYED